VSKSLHECLKAHTSAYMPTRVSTCLHECPQALQIKVAQYVEHNMFPLKTVGKYKTFFSANTDRAASLMYTHTYIEPVSP